MSAQVWDEGDATLARDVLGTSVRDEAVAKIRHWLAAQGLHDPQVISIELSVGAAVGVQLRDRSRLFAKFWSHDVEQSSLEAQLHVQDAMALRGFPAPKLQTALIPFGEGCGVLMDFDRSGVPTDTRIPGVLEAMACGLAELIRQGDDLKATPNLAHRTWPQSLWPKPHNVLFDFEGTAQGAEWIDTVARRSLETLHRTPQVPVLGHLDWSAKNMRMTGLSLAIVYDWDSVFVSDEAYVVGGAAATYPTTWELPVPSIPTIEESLAFIAAFEDARGAPFTREERDRVLASTSYMQCYTARCDHAVNPQRARDRWGSILGKLIG